MYHHIQDRAGILATQVLGYTMNYREFTVACCTSVFTSFAYGINNIKPLGCDLVAKCLNAFYLTEESTMCKRDCNKYSHAVGILLS